MSKTYDNLMEAFAGESQANRKYLAFAASVRRISDHAVGLSEYFAAK